MPRQSHHYQKVGRKPVDDLGSGSSLLRALDAALVKRGEPSYAWARAKREAARTKSGVEGES